jgi:hypothetical protein
MFTGHVRGRGYDAPAAIVHDNAGRHDNIATYDHSGHRGNHHDASRSDHDGSRSDHDPARSNHDSATILSATD